MPEQDDHHQAETENALPIGAVESTPEAVEPAPEMAVEHEPEENQVERLNQVFNLLHELKVYPMKLIQGGDVIDLQADETTGASPHRSFVVLEVAVPDPEVESAICKVCTRETRRVDATNEILFMRHGFDLIRRNLPADVVERVDFPDIMAADETAEQPYILQEKMEGRAAGSVNLPTPGMLDEQDISDIATVINACRQIDLDELLGLAPGLRLDDVRLTQGDQRYIQVGYAHYLETRESRVRPLIGDDYWERLQALFANSRELFEEAPAVFAAGDVNASNLIKGQKLGMIDWERIRTTNSPALDYGFLFATLKDTPELQQAFYDKARELNQDVENFDEFFRLEYVFNRGTGELGVWVDRAEQATTDEERETYLKHARDYAEGVRAALDRTGIWAEPDTEQAA